MDNEVTSATVAVTNTAFTAFTNPLANATFIQISLETSSQAFTLRFTDNTTIRIPAGREYNFGPLKRTLPAGNALGEVQTETGADNLQVNAMRAAQ